MTGDTDITAATDTELQQLSNLVHDCWLDVGGLIWDKAQRLVRLPIATASAQGRFGSTKSPPASDYTHSLDIRNALDVRVDDGAKVRFYDVGALRFDSTTRSVIIEANIPLSITVAITDLDVRLVKSEVQGV